MPGRWRSAGRREVSAKDPVVIASFGGMKHAIEGEVAVVREFAGSWEYMLDEAICTIPVHPYWGGAALIDASGSLVGCGSLYVEHSLDGGETVPGNLFVPIDLLAPIRGDMVRTGRALRAPRPWLGAYVAESDDRLVVTGVAANGPGDQYGMQPGDFILSVEGVAVSGLPEYYRTIWAAGEPGEEIRLTVPQGRRRAVDTRALGQPLRLSQTAAPALSARTERPHRAPAPSARLGGHSDSTASSTLSTCPLTLTLRQILRTMPVSSIRKVARSIPIYFLPYMDFSTQIP